MRDVGPSLEQATPWMAAFRDSIVVIKLGGELLARPSVCDHIVRQIATVAHAGLRPVVVHGAGAQIDEACRVAGLEIKKIGGRRITDAATVGIVRDVLFRLNADLAGRMRAEGLAVQDAAQMGVWPVVATRRPPVTAAGGDTVDFGFVGDIESVHARSEHVVPLVPSIGHSAADGWLNINADSVAVALARAWGAKKVVFLTSVAGIMLSPDDPGPVSRMNLSAARALLGSTAVTGGMRAKLEESVRALEDGVSQVHIVSGLQPYTLTRELFTDEGCGTLITQDEE